MTLRRFYIVTQDQDSGDLLEIKNKNQPSFSTRVVHYSFILSISTPHHTKSLPDFPLNFYLCIF